MSALDDQDAELRGRHGSLVYAWAATPFWRPRKRQRLDAEIRQTEHDILALQPQRWKEWMNA